MIHVVDLGIGNIGSVGRALSYLKVEYAVTSDALELSKAKKILLPGVGSFQPAAEALNKNGIRETLRAKALEEQVPFLGICLGMQLLLEVGREGGTHSGLGLIRGTVDAIDVDRTVFSIPHMGWNDVQSNNLDMFKGLPESSCFYFVHSYEVKSSDPVAKIAYTEYGNKKICAAIEKDNIWGAQFHPEKSQAAGLKILKNFADIYA